MKLQFKQNYIPGFLYNELEFDSFLKLFKDDFPIIPSVILSPLSKKEGIKHFNDLKQMEHDLNLHKISLEQLISLSRLIQNPVDAITALKTTKLQQYHLHILGNFFTTNLQLLELEGEMAIDGKIIHQQILSTLDKYCTESYGSLKTTPQITTTKNELLKIKTDLNTQIQHIEKEIFQETGIRMIYPYPHEIKKDRSIKPCRHITISNVGNYKRVNFNLDNNVTKIINQKKKIEKQLNSIHQDTLAKICSELKDAITTIGGHVNERKKRCLQYCIIRAKKEQNLCFPEFSNAVHLTKATLPSLKRLNQKRYCPLSLKLKKGATILFGANMTGKTSVLKTLYFQLQITRFGLPIPTASATFPFPEKVSFLLRSSGSTQKNLSSFGEELNFFSREFTDNEYILVDELFNSTSPFGGIELSNIFINFFKNRNSIFFCNSHYHEVISNDGIDRLKMKDSDIQGKESDIVENLLNSIPFEVEPITSTEIEKKDIRPLEIALCFPLSEDLKTAIKKRIKHGTN